jgi:hypothetical protein
VGVVVMGLVFIGLVYLVGDDCSVLFVCSTRLDLTSTPSPNCPTIVACLLASSLLHFTDHQRTDHLHPTTQQHNTTSHKATTPATQRIAHKPTHPATRPSKPQQPSRQNVLLPLLPPHKHHRPLQHPPPHPPLQRRRRRHRRRLAHLPRPARLLHRKSPPFPALAASRPQ